MSTERHLEGWRNLLAAAMESIPTEVECYALVAVSPDGELFWGAKYGLRKTHPILRRGLRMLSEGAKKYAEAVELGGEPSALEFDDDHVSGGEEQGEVSSD